MTSFVSPVLAQGKFTAIAGCDVSLNNLDAAIKQIKLYSSGYAFLVSNTGIFISAPDTALIGSQNLGAFAKEKANAQLEQMAADIKAGKAGSLEAIDPFTGKNVAISTNLSIRPIGAW